MSRVEFPREKSRGRAPEPIASRAPTTRSRSFGDRTWQRLSVGAGAHGPREYDWTRRQIDGAWKTERGHWLLARRSISDPTAIAYYICCGPTTARLVDLAWTAWSRWHVEDAFQQAQGEVGIDHYQVGKWRAWNAHITLSMLALAWLAATKTLAAKGEPANSMRT